MKNMQQITKKLGYACYFQEKEVSDFIETDEKCDFERIDILQKKNIRIALGLIVNEEFPILYSSDESLIGKYFEVTFVGSDQSKNAGIFYIRNIRGMIIDKDEITVMLHDEKFSVIKRVDPISAKSLSDYLFMRENEYDVLKPGRNCYAVLFDDPIKA
jgi:hypothetical protein